MADIKTPAERSRNMSAIKGKDTKPEIYIRKLLFSRGYRYRKNCPKITGHPDIWLAKYRTVVFIHGCFWHRHPGCKYAYTPKSRVSFWTEKFETNIARDLRVKEDLRKQGIRCVVVWECVTRKMKSSPEYEAAVIERIADFLVCKDEYLEIEGDCFD